MTRRKDTPKCGLSNAEKLALRDAAVVRIRAALAEKPMTIPQLVAELHLPERSTYNCLAHMAEIGVARRTGEKASHNRQFWELGQEDLEKPVRIMPHPQGAVIVPARQVGMWRHWMDEALFGPARRVA